jgi:FtsH-binding integral membrane protein
MDFLKTVGGKIISGLVALGVLAAGISWWQMDPSTRQMLLTGTGRIASWLGIVLFVPWISFFLIGRVAKLENNAAGGALILGITIIEALLLGWLFRWNVHGATAITFFLAASLLAGVYNLFACDWIAEQLE